MRLKILREHRHVLLAARHAARAARNTLHYSFTGKTYAAKHLEKQFRARPDPWDFESSAAGLERFQKTWELVPHRHYRRILEIGCAEGHFTEQIVDRFPDAEVLAVDFIPLALERARVRCGSRPNVKFEGVDLATQTVRGGFDLIFCMGVLEYGPTLGQLDAIRDRILGLLAPGGYLLLQSPRVLSEQRDPLVGAAARVRRARTARSVRGPRRGACRRSTRVWRLVCGDAPSETGPIVEHSTSTVGPTRTNVGHCA